MIGPQALFPLGFFQRTGRATVTPDQPPRSSGQVGRSASFAPCTTSSPTATLKFRPGRSALANHHQSPPTSLFRAFRQCSRYAPEYRLVPNHQPLFESSERCRSAKLRSVPPSSPTNCLLSFFQNRFAMTSKPFKIFS